MADTVAVDNVKEALSESLTSAKDVTVVAVRDDILPAVTAVALAAKDAAAPAYSEAHLRASNAVSALKGSDAAAVLIATGAAGAGALRGKAKSSRRPSKKVVFVSLVGLGGATYGILRKRRAPAADIYANATMPSVVPVPDAEEIALDETTETTD
jgi:hypothetical protein